MKTTTQLPMAVLAAVALHGSIQSGISAAISPVFTGDGPVATAIGSRQNVAAAAAGATPFSSSDLTPDYAANRLNDGVINNSGNSWIPATTGTTEFAGVSFGSAQTIASLVFHGQPGYNGRSGGTWVFQYTRDASPSGTSTWNEIGTYTYAEAGCATPMPRSIFSFPAIQNVTGVRLLLANSACGIQLAVQEIEAYGPISGPPGITTHPTGGTAVEGDIFTFSVEAENAESFQWQRDGTNITSATSSSFSLLNVAISDAAPYRVIVSNVNGSLTSNPAILQVTPAPTFNSYTEAVLSGNPIHYYPLNESTGTTAEDLGSLATAGGIFTGGIQLGQPSVTSRLGTAIRLDGAAGTFVDLGRFHAGDSISVEAWVRLDTGAPTNSYHAIVARWDGSFEIDFAPGDVANFVVRRDGNGFGIAAATGASTRAQWHHVVGVFHNGIVTIYVDGVKGSEQNIGGVLQDAGPDPDRIMIGATRSGTTGSFNFRGLIDEVAIYDYALSASQIRSHFRAVDAPAPTVSIQSAVIVSWPSFPPGYVLQSSSEVNGTYSNYTGATYTEGNLIKAALPVGESHRYFRLHKPE